MAKEHFIQKAIKHPGAMKRAAAKADMTTQEYMQKHKDDPGKTGQRARLGLTLTKMTHKRFGQAAHGK